ncbi:MAG: UvrD-helicase domain-containing protein [Bacteroidales bacterium]
MQALKVLKASAGSGKTFQLAIEYIKLILQNPNAHRQILAVSFTNKATTEMKNRILGELYGMAYHCSDSKLYLEYIANELGIDKEEVSTKSKIALSALLHDYSRFNIETIDSFNQGLLRNLAKELGIGASFNIELDSRKALNEAVSNLIDELNSESSTLKWICQILQEKEEDQKSGVHIQDEIVNAGMKIFEEAFGRRRKEVEAFFGDRQIVENYIRQLNAKQKSETAKLQKQIEAFYHILSQENLNLKDFKTGSMTGYFTQIEKGKLPTEAQLTKIEEGKLEWFKKGDKRQEAPFIDSLNALVLNTEALRPAVQTTIYSCQLILQHLRYMALLNEISLQLTELNKQNNRFLLSDTSALLAEMIGDSDISFIHEKIGANLSHILIDEFQDTSDLQWKNFKQMLDENLAQGKENLIVGDVKQSIYRWRNSNWETLNTIENKFSPSLIQVETLQTNYRTDKVIVEFNNHLFTRIATQENSLLAQKFASDFPHGKAENFNKICTAYKDVVQISNNKTEQGFVELSFVKTKDGLHKIPNAMSEQLIQRILYLKENQIPAQDIMILVRWNKQIPEFSQSLARYKNEHTELSQEDKNYFTLISDEAFSLGSSMAILILIEALECLNNQNNAIVFAQLAYHYKSEIEGDKASAKKIFAVSSRTNKVSNSTEMSNSENQINKPILFHLPFADFLPLDFVENYSFLRKTPLYELLEKLIRIFGLDQQTSQHAYLYSFLDEVNAYVAQNDANIEAFLTYWDESLQSKPIAINQEVPGIRILSIHKAKGLEFHSVIIPNCDWNIQEYSTYTRANDLWCNPKNKDSLFDTSPLIPIAFSEKMKDSYFKEEYEIECIRQWVDNLNLLYVALTRPKHNLFILSSQLGKSELNTPNYGKINSILYTLADPQKADINGDTISYLYGELYTQKDCIQTSENKLKTSSEELKIPFSSTESKARYHLSRDAKQCFLMQEENIDTESLAKGKRYHKLLEYMETLSDTELAIQRLIAEGLITQEEKPLYTSWLKRALENPLVRNWFSGKAKLFNERAIVFQNEYQQLQTQRPDRVMLEKDGHLILVDYKTGKKYKQYETQLQNYVQLLKKMGYQNTQAFIWYLELFEIDEIDEKTSI